jgi:formylglycine-generating enzyme required for sulfatase activity
MREDAKTICELKEQIKHLSAEREKYLNTFLPESYADISLLFSGVNKVSLKRHVITIKDVEYAFCWCPTGTFIMGDSNKQHTITLTKGFWIGETEVTQEQWRVTGTNHEKECHFKGTKLPVENVSWDECQLFISDLNKSGVAPNDYEFSLPTEAQWEYACRAGSKADYCFGNDVLELGDYAWYDDNSNNKTHEVGTKKKNLFGLYDMHGNVWELCNDWYGNDLSDDASDPTGANVGSSRVSRGGSWYSGAQTCRSAFRNDVEPSFRGNAIGLRLVLVAKTAEINELNKVQKQEMKTESSSTRRIIRGAFEKEAK